MTPRSPRRATRGLVGIPPSGRVTIRSVEPSGQATTVRSRPRASAPSLAAVRTDHRS